MSTRLTDQLHQYFSYVDDEQGAVDVAEAVGASGTTVRERPRFDPPARRVRWGLVAVAAAFTLAALLPFILLARDSEPVVATTPPAPTTTAAPATSTSTTQSPPTTATAQPTAPAPQGTTMVTGTARWARVTGDAITLPHGHILGTPDGYVTTEIADTFAFGVAGREGDPKSYYWASQDGLSWGPIGVPSGAVVPLLTSNENGLWLIDHGDPIRVWRSDLDGPLSQPESWQPVDVSALDGLTPFLKPSPTGRIQNPSELGQGWRDDSDVLVSNGLIVVGQWSSTPGLTPDTLIVSDNGGPFERIPVPWSAPQSPGGAEIVSFEGRFYAYPVPPLGDAAIDPGVWASDDGRSWTREGSFGFTNSERPDEYAWNLEVVEHDGVLLAQGGYFCGVGDLWRSTNGVEWTHIGSSPDRGVSCGGLLRASESGWVFVTDRGNERWEPKIWTSADGDNWSEIDSSPVAFEPDNGRVVSVVGEAIFLLSQSAVDRVIWVGRPAEAVVIEDGACRTSLDGEPRGAPLHIQLSNTTNATAAMVVAAYTPGTDRDDLIAYGRDISTRPEFLESRGIYEVPPGGTEEITLDEEPGTYALVCMDTASTMVVLPDLVVTG